MSALVEFLRARLDEDERTWHTAATAPRRAGKTHARRHLADIMAKRRIVDLRESWQAQAERFPADNPTDIAAIIWQSQVVAIDAALRALASAYVSHPDYRDEWPS